MSVIVQIAEKGRTTVEITDGMTTAQLVQKIKDDEGLEFRGGYNLIETMTGRTMAEDEIVVDGRYYWLSAWVWSVLQPKTA